MTFGCAPTMAGCCRFLLDDPTGGRERRSVQHRSCSRVLTVRLRLAVIRRALGAAAGAGGAATETSVDIMATAHKR